MHRSTVLLLSALALIPASFAAQNADEAAIRELLHLQAEAWNRADGNAFAKDFAADADFVNIRGDVFRGRGEIAARHTFILEGPFKGSHLSLSIRRFTMPTPDVAIVETDHELTGFVRMMPGIALTAPGVLRTHMKYVALKSGGTWQFVAAQNTAIVPSVQ